MSFVRNNWYVVAWSHEIDRALLSRQILDESIVMYRTQAGDVVAFLDVCPHKKLPLSHGRLKGDSIECGYHGIRFDCTGVCERVPGQGTVPAASVVKKYPIAERMGCVWAWMGDPELADESQIFDLPEFHDKQWSAVHGDALEIDANYMLLADNLCDPAHVSFVHQTTLGNEDGEDVPVNTEKQGNSVITHRWVLDSTPIPLFQKFGNFKGKVDRWHYYYFHAPNIAIIDFGSADVGTGAPQGARDNCIQLFACHFLTPVSEGKTIDFWMHVKNFQPKDAETNEQLSDAFREAFQEDKTILEACQKEEDKDHQWRPLRLAIDRGPQRMQKIVQKMLDDEKASSIK